MRFNVHCHVFNLQSVFNDATAFILENRMVDDHGLQRNVARIIINKLKHFMAYPGGFDSVGSDPGDFSPAWTPGFLGRTQVFWEALHVAMLKNMDLVTDYMVQQLGDDVIFIPMMMDILIQQQTEFNPNDIFHDQIRYTQRQILRYPGRILPFYAVNPYRWDFVNQTIQALSNGGFVGVKLYPSLGYDISTPGMDEVMHFCNSNHIPLLMHCNNGGFKQSNATAAYCDPKKWGLFTDGYLDNYSELKICFAHFGGAENFNGPDVITENSWTNDILALMEAYPERVFADVGYHNEALNPATSQTYFQGLNAIMDDPRYQGQVLWGTDTWLLRMECTELAYWGAFTPTDMSEDTFKLMSQNNPRSFLGIDASNPRENIINFMSYMQSNQIWNSTEALDWLTNSSN